jgi:cell division protein FtsI (penicillin-binding protein 3)/stage V sporulation protein D (sporulation-specific penicillin-binding protein)
MQKARFVTRVRVTVIFCVLAALVLIGKLYYLQVINGDLYAARADSQLLRPAQTLLLRDSIYLTDKENNLVLAATLGSDATSTLRQRYYPGGSLAAQEIGFVAYNGDKLEGRYGLERYYEQTLAREQETLYSNFFVELFGAAKAVLGGESQTGDVVTTLEPTVQAELERTLQNYDNDWSPKLAGGIIMDPKTGEIVGMAVTPTFDLNAFNKEKTTSIFANALVENVYEMGSIIKPLTMAAGLDSGVITPQSTYNDTGEITLDQKTIRNHDGRARGTVDMQQVLSQSLNLGASYVAQKLGPENMREYFLQKYRLGVETGIDLPGEVHGLMEGLQSPRKVEYSTAGFGQGIAMTPIETVRALATLANGGKLVTPHLTKAIRYDSGYTHTLFWGSEEQVLKPQTSTQISRMLTEVVDKALLEGKIKIERYSVAAKTGTAQIANPQGGGYYDDRFLHSFFGYFPSYNARFIVFLFAVEPTGAPFASQTLTRPFHTLTTFLISYYNIPPDR